MSIKSLLFAIGFTMSSAASAGEPINLLEQVQTEVAFVESPMIQEIPEQPEPQLEVSEQQIDCLARVMHHEARGEGRRGQMAVGYVVVNRKHDSRFPSTICRVTTQPYQFSNFRLNKRIKNYGYFYSLAQELVSSYDTKNDPSRGALFFHTTSIKPRWSYRKTASATIRRHVFYR